MEVGVRKLRDSLSSYLERVQQGAEIIVTDHGRPVARLVPVGERPLDQLIAEGVVQPARKHGRSHPSPVAAAGTVSDLVAEQRR